MNLPSGYFDDLFRNSDDPWGMRSRFYEKRKRDLTLGALPAARFGRGFEPGCANGELSSALAERCDDLLVSDSTPRAFELAKKRLGALGNVRVTKLKVPEAWPDGTFDLVVLSELGYFLDRAELTRVFELAVGSLSGVGVLLLCHWRRPIAGCELDGDDVHAAFGKGRGLTHLVHHLEPDFVLDVHTKDPRSVGEIERIF